MRLTQFIKEETDTILREWVVFAEEIDPSQTMSSKDLLDHGKEMLLAIADDIGRPQSMEKRHQKAKGDDSGSDNQPAREHGVLRLASGFSIEHVVAEFRALRASVTELWARHAAPFSEDQVRDLIRFNEAVDEAVDVSVTSYAHEKELSVRLFTTALKYSPDATYILDMNCRFTYANTATEKLAKLPREQIVGANACDEQSPVPQGLREAIVRVIESGQPDHGEVAVDTGEETWHEYSLIPVRDGDEAMDAIVGISRDITERKVAEAETWHRANYDELTQLPNRRLFFDRLDQSVEHSARNHQPLAVLYLDLNGFKQINDTLGHEAGDQLLRDMADTLKSCVRKSDTAARLGGDEFCILLTDLQNNRDVNSVVEKISDALDVQFCDMHVSASIGVAMCPQDAEDSDELLRKADQAMYIAKKSKRQKICFYVQTESVDRNSTIH